MKIFFKMLIDSISLMVGIQLIILWIVLITEDYNPYYKHWMLSFLYVGCFFVTYWVKSVIDNK